MRFTAVRTPLKPALIAAVACGALIAATVQTSATVPVPAAEIPAGTPDVLLTDQASRRVLLLDGGRRAWDPGADPAVVKWAFSPVGDARYADLEPEASWVHPSEAKVRRWRGRTYVLTVASFGFAAVVAYPSGARYWGAALSPGTIRHNPHSIELLPDGNVAVAGSTGGVVRLYAASRGRAGVPYVDHPLKDAHGLHWDGGRRVLWALGGDRLVALRVGGTAARPTLREVAGARLPAPHGHDLGPVAGDPDRLWVSSGSAVHQYEKSTGTFRSDFPGAAGISRARVKAVGDDPVTGQVISTVPERGLGETWWTRTVAVHRPAGRYRLAGGGVYKARWWTAWCDRWGGPGGGGRSDGANGGDGSGGPGGSVGSGGPQGPGTPAVAVVSGGTVASGAAGAKGVAAVSRVAGASGGAGAANVPGAGGAGGAAGWCRP
ncbi:DUF6528 family protein [Streptomyces lavendofoliae]|uniref:DUF6528 family protein n=1 Tax=Streptomyces lavendofoliae TaxID=67314 RepID=UPI003D914F82